MRKEEPLLLEKFKKFTGWMCNDIERTMFYAQANFLVAMALFNYIEILGTFLMGYFQKDRNGGIKKGKRRNIKTSTTDRFNRFFSYLGPEYGNLLKGHPKIYDELRCGLTHEYLPKNYDFCIYGHDTILTEEQMDNIINIDGSPVACGVVFLYHNQNKLWQVFTPKLFIDFKRGINKLIKEIESGKDKELMNNFFETAKQINLKNFK